MKTMFLKFSKEVKGLIFASIILSSITTMSFIGLMALSAYLIVLSAFHPSIAALQIVIVGVRFFGISRSVFRYLERLMSHSANLRILKNIRVNVFQQIAKNFPFNLPGKTSYELLGFLIQDIEFLENLFVRIILPIISTLFVTIIVSLFFSAFSFELILVAILGFIMVGVCITTNFSKTWISKQQEIGQRTFELSKSTTKFFPALSGIINLLSKRKNNLSNSGGRKKLCKYALENSYLSIILLRVEQPARPINCYNRNMGFFIINPKKPIGYYFCCCILFNFLVYV